ncbi:PRC-barrel domain containing protein [bacterium]|nr:PRC-barrel domain containing protein [bacterium]
MLRSTREIQGYTILALDGPMGSIEEFFFDDQSWATRYAVVNTGIWLFGKKVLLTPVLFTQLDSKNQCLPVKLNIDQVKNSPEIDTDKPVSRQLEQHLHRFFGWMPYWENTALGAVPSPIASSSDIVEEQETNQNPHLRRTNEVFGYGIQSQNGSIGHLDDFILDDRLWLIRYAVVEIKDVLSKKKVLLSRDWIQKISWEDQKLYLDLDREFVKNSPEFIPENAVNREFETRLYDYYDRPKYWS